MSPDGHPGRGAGLLLDADLLADYLRGNEQAGEFIENVAEDLSLAAVSAAELYARCRNQGEAEVLDRFLGAFRLLPADATVARLSGELRRAHPGCPSEAALVAATAQLLGLRVVALDPTRFPMLDDVLVPYGRTVG